jgi:hypothetical protein
MTIDDTYAGPPLFAESAPQRHAVALYPDERYGQA